MNQKNGISGTCVSYVDHNAGTIDRWIEEGWEWGRPISHEEFEEARNGRFSMLLTPTKPVPASWYLPFEGCRVLGLASGGGQQMPIFTALGACCTVLDYSPRQLRSEEEVARREGYSIKTVRASMTDPLPFADASFDLIFHPVSNCYIEEVEPVWRECFRVLRPGGRLLAGMDNGINYIVDASGQHIVRGLPYNPLKGHPQLTPEELEEEGCQFSHTLEEQLGGQLKTGFRLLDLYEDTNGYGFLHQQNIPTFWASLAEKPL